MNELEERLLDRTLEVVLGGERPPDLTRRILEAAARMNRPPYGAPSPHAARYGRMIIMAASILMFAGILATLLRDSPQEEFLRQVRELVERMKSEKVEVRQAARAGLIGMGARAVDVLAGLPPSADPEATAQIDDVIRAIVEGCFRLPEKNRQSFPVTLEIDQAPYGTVIENLRRQCPFRIEYDDRSVSDFLRVERLRLSKAPLREALEAMEMAVMREEPGRIWVARPPRLTFTFRSADVRVIFDMISRTTGVRVRPDESVRGVADLTCANVPWMPVVDETAAKAGCLAVRTSDNDVAIRPKADFESELTSRSFPLRHLVLEDPAPGRAAPLARLMEAIELKLTRGASWATVHGGVSYDARRRMISITDQAGVVEAASKLISDSDR